MLTSILLILTIHFIADFILQSDWMAINKSKNWWALVDHVIVYTLPFLLVFGFKFAAITLVTHFIQDAITSRINVKLWLANQRHWFFVGIGADQLLHYYTLIGTLWLLQ